MLDQPIVMLDFETTGLSPAMGDRVVERYVSLVNCQARISSFITGLTGITQAMVDAAPPVAQVLPQLLDFIGADALSAHNASFDDKFLRAEAARLALTPRHRALVCSLKLARRVFPDLPSYQLGHLSGQLGIRFQRAAHRAEADAEVAAEVLIHIGRHLGATYGIAAVDPELLMSVNRLAAAKVPQFLQKHAMRSSRAASNDNISSSRI